MSDLDAVRFHEGGHAALAIYLGADMRDAQIWYARGSRRHGGLVRTWTEAVDARTVEAYILVALSGAEAEARALTIFDGYAPADALGKAYAENIDGDTENVHLVLDEMDFDANLAAMSEHAGGLVDQLWPEITMIADGLLQQNYLDGAQLCDLYDAARLVVA